MQCYEHQLLCLTLEKEIRALSPSGRVDRADVSDALAEHGVVSVASLAEIDLTAVAAKLAGAVSLAA